MRSGFVVVSTAVSVIEESFNHKLPFALCQGVSKQCLEEGHFFPFIWYFVTPAPKPHHIWFETRRRLNPVVWLSTICGILKLALGFRCPKSFICPPCHSVCFRLTKINLKRRKSLTWKHHFILMKKRLQHLTKFEAEWPKQNIKADKKLTSNCVGYIWGC